MESLTELYRIGPGPSASHTMGPKRAAEIFAARHAKAASFRADLYGSLAATGRGHLTDEGIMLGIGQRPCDIQWHAAINLPMHPNGMEFSALDGNGDVLEVWRVYSVGGGALQTENGDFPSTPVYELDSMEDVLGWCSEQKSPLWRYVFERESADGLEHLEKIWVVMQEAIERGIQRDDRLPGMLNLKRKSRRHFEQAKDRPGALQKTGLLTAYSLAVSEENAGGGVIVTAPTCGACGVLPGVLKYLNDELKCRHDDIIKALATASIVGNLVKSNASISGAAVGCQGEVGTACSMAAAAATQLMGGTIAQIEYAAEMAFEHHLGLTCDPIAGLVQIPCIERNAVAATRAIGCAEYALLSDGEHEISFDAVVETMRLTGQDLQERYRETSLGGLATAYTLFSKPNQCS